MNFKRLALFFVLLFACVSCTLSAAEIKKWDAYYTISVEDIEKSLPAEPIAIGLDVDDTALFSSPGFYYAFNNTDGPNGENIYGPKPLSNMKFWDDQCTKFDKLSIPKASAKRLIDMHKKRGDKIFFITARPEAPKNEVLTELLHKAFGLGPEQPKAIFTGYKSKAIFIKKNNVKVYYGDSDSDITEAWDAGIRAIRFLRSPLSTNKGKYHPGKYGEAVLENSVD
ncbi:MAG: acid phosphatase AphA [Candidatus Riflebacteria bacterium]|nr:acid phosphatase AphA [Candidatus Riflebacteria bacterium]